MDAKTARKKSIKAAAENEAARKALEEKNRQRKQAMLSERAKSRLEFLLNVGIPDAVEDGRSSTWVMADESDGNVTKELLALGYKITYETTKFSDDDLGTEVMVISWA